MAAATESWPGNGLTRAGCWAHLRRRILEAEKSAPETEAIELVRHLYEVEREAKGASAQARLELRRQHSAPVLGSLKERLLVWQREVLPKHPMAEAVSYALGQWEELNVFCSDGAVPVDNNVSEREMERVVLNRKNSLFVGNARGGRTAAILASLTSTCRRHGVDPQLYLTQLLGNLPTLRTSPLADWLPDQWKLHLAAPAPAATSSSHTAHCFSTPLAAAAALSTLAKGTCEDPPMTAQPNSSPHCTVTWVARSGIPYKGD